MKKKYLVLSTITLFTLGSMFLTSCGNSNKSNNESHQHEEGENNHDEHEHDEGDHEDHEHNEAEHEGHEH